MKRDKNELFTARAREAQIRALADFMTGRMSPRFADRLQPSAFGVYGFAARSQKYQRQQIKVLGAVFPYYGPWRRNYARLATAILRGKVKAVLSAVRNLVTRQVHLRELITKPGVGFAINQTGTRKIVTQLTLPGASALNRAGSKGRLFRQQLGDLTRGGNRDAIAVYRRMNDLLQGHLWRPIANTPLTRVA
jgi:hypothetical protein